MYRSFPLQDVRSHFSDLAAGVSVEERLSDCAVANVRGQRCFPSISPALRSCTNSLICPVVAKCLSAGHVKVPDNIQALHTPQWTTKNPKLLQEREAMLIGQEGKLCCCSEGSHFSLERLPLHNSQRQVLSLSGGC